MNNDLSVREILDKYNEDPELLKYILTAKSEEDKKKAARDTLRAEEARIQLRQMDLDFAREQSKASARYERGTPANTAVFAHPVHPQPVQGPPQSAYPHHQSSYGPYYGLDPVQQQVLARFHHPPGSNHAAPASPSIPYPHSAHPLCPPTNNESRLPFRLKSPPPSSSPVEEGPAKKRHHSSMSSPSHTDEIQGDKISHNRVMEALKAKIQRGGNGTPPSPLIIAAPPSRSLSLTAAENNKKRKATLPRPVVVHQTIGEGSSPSPSPRSAKPVLPPIDTSLGRLDTTATSHITKPTSQEKKHVDSAVSTSSSSSSSNSSHTSSSSSNHQSQISKPDAVASPSDHILLNTRRARSLSPPSLVKKA